MFEALRGLPMPFGPALVGGSAVGTSVQAGLAIPSRLVGSFTQPNSLGVAAVVLLAFAISYLPHHKTGPPRASSRFMAVPMGSDSVYRGGLYSAEPLNRSVGEGLDSPAIDQSGTRSDPSVSLRGLWIVALLSVLLARSGTGLIVLLALFLWSASQQWPALFHRSRLALAATTVLLMTFLPNLLGRPDLWRSPLGRWQAAVEGMTQAGPLQWLFGQGLAANSNQLISLLGPQSALHSGSSDGMPVLLLLQSGLFGVAAFYGLLLWAWNRDPVSRPFLMAVGIVSLTLNITELFPINLLLAFGLAGLLAPSPQSMLPVKS
ncbi:hypothetical protein [Synechococcus sp. CBW1004]|uniref:hypothetical protein n=1 Tax=Synechococcus sp. CBW1004 TaxID=1353136 RepID=UPI0018CE930D|nr:hypothetical protein [Synechococcus sp. CBW1004]QPN64294.1 hypothetical protein H8F25_05915 [Synechococcus sp. CBW1004]